MTTMLGFVWDIWPADTGTARIAVGHAMSEATARQEVEQLLAADEAAFFGTMIKPGYATLICRRGREPGTYVWYELCEWNGDHPAVAAGIAAAGPEGAGR